MDVEQTIIETLHSHRFGTFYSAFFIRHPDLELCIQNTLVSLVGAAWGAIAASIM
jgi:hypothetical protein